MSNLAQIFQLWDGHQTLGTFGLYFFELKFTALDFSQYLSFEHWTKTF